MIWLFPVVSHDLGCLSWFCHDLFLCPVVCFCFVVFYCTGIVLCYLLYCFRAVIWSCPGFDTSYCVVQCV